MRLAAAALLLVLPLPAARARAPAIPALHADFLDALQRGQHRRAAGLIEQVNRLAVEEGREGAGGAAADAGRWTAADYAADMSARFALERERWDEAMAFDADAVDGDAAKAALLFARGVAAARAAWPGGHARLIDLARQAAARLGDLAASAPPAVSRALERRRVLILAAISASQEEREEMRVLLAQAASLEGTGGAVPAGLGLPIPARELEGDLWLQVARYRDAQRAYAASLAGHPGRARSLLGLARAAARGGDADVAKQAYADLLLVWTDADPDLPALTEARAYLAQHDGNRRDR
jgi:hypothetical protein